MRRHAGSETGHPCQQPRRTSHAIALRWLNQLRGSGGRREIDPGAFPSLIRGRKSANRGLDGRIRPSKKISILTADCACDRDHSRVMKVLRRHAPAGVSASTSTDPRLTLNPENNASHGASRVSRKQLAVPPLTPLTPLTLLTLLTPRETLSRLHPERCPASRDHIASAGRCARTSSSERVTGARRWWRAERSVPGTTSALQPRPRSVAMALLPSRKREKPPRP
jgi:hypothetical protein